MGNAAVAQAARPHVPREDRFSVRFLTHVFVGGEVAYEFAVSTPARLGLAPGPPPEFGVQSVRHTYRDFQALGDALLMQYGEQCPELPPSTFFECIEPAFIGDRAMKLEQYLEAVLELEPTPKLRKLRTFLNVWHSPAAASVVPPASLLCGSGRQRLPVDVAACILRFGGPLWILRSCSAVSRSMYSASRNPRCWPSLRFRTCRAERRLDGFFSILIPVCGGLEALELSAVFGDARLSAAVPAGLSFPRLRRLALHLGDAEATELAVEILECIESPSLQRVAIAATRMTEPLLQAVCRVALAASAGADARQAAGGRLVSLRLLWLPTPWAPSDIDEGTALALAQVLDVAPHLEEFALAVPPSVRGSGALRSLAPLQPPYVDIPGTQPLLATTASLSSLQFLTFDFLSNEVLMCFQGLAERSWVGIRRAVFSGVKRHLSDPDAALVTLLSKMGDQLEEFSLIVEVEAEMREFMSGFLRTRIGALPAVWRDRRALRRLEVNWTAFDTDGMLCIQENCQGLRTLLLDRSEYWQDAVCGGVSQNLAELQHFRLRSSALLSDQSLYSLGEVAHRFRQLEIEPSPVMSSFALNQLQQRLCPGADHVAGDIAEYLNPAGGAVSLMAAITGEDDPFNAPAPNIASASQLRSRRASKALILLKPEWRSNADQTHDELQIFSETDVGWVAEEAHCARRRAGMQLSAVGLLDG